MNIFFQNKQHFLRYAILLMSLVFFSTLTLSCASSKSASVYTRDQARKAAAVKLGVVTHVRTVLIEGTKSPAGTLAGGALGGVAGSAVGGGKGRSLMTVVGAIAGAAAGSAAEEGMTRKEGLEITVKLEDGTVLAVVQEADETFQVGDAIRVLKTADGTTRVTH